MTRSLYHIWQIFFAMTTCYMQIAFWNNVQAQELNKEVYVIRPYEPVLSDVNKINLLPEIEDITTTPPEFSYAISSKRIPSSFELLLNILNGNLY